MQTVSALFKIAQKTVLKKPIKPLKTQSWKYKTNFRKIFPFPLSAYVQLLSVQDKDARKFYEEEVTNSPSFGSGKSRFPISFIERNLLSVRQKIKVPIG